ncbi:MULTISPECIES: helix-turn-helix transcriptional regulator [unclassified Oleiphilus]|uniref:helix-turn-helix domain-containing protein n=1 Tax=unclassified Oleiphilus TaxID=2631174 RepID=UPI0007C37447|nr:MULTISPECIES: helix-turn-helix transcriptional regulator [unclassified Oleiphilus]KZZ33642.1 hypothetical protein A3757_19010 [Oleiphilus sp. HI0117]KZZ52873.1 hypothetical protein A3761_18875 [Oleiphilus sp. HI0123]
MNKTISSDNYKSLISWLKLCRKEAGLTQRDISSRLNYANSFVPKVELLERKLDVYEYVKYCAVIGVDPRDGIAFLEGKKFNDEN